MVKSAMKKELTVLFGYVYILKFRVYLHRKILK